MISASLFKCVCSHANIVFSAICVACGGSCFVYDVLSREFVLRRHVFLFLQLFASLFVLCGSRSINICSKRAIFIIQYEYDNHC